MLAGPPWLLGECRTAPATYYFSGLVLAGPTLKGNTARGVEPCVSRGYVTGAQRMAVIGSWPPDRRGDAPGPQHGARSPALRRVAPICRPGPGRTGAANRCRAAKHPPGPCGTRARMA